MAGFAGDKGRLYRTTDGGETWEVRTLGGGVAFYGVRFLDPKKGFLSGIDPAAGRAALYETSDGGATWKRREDLPQVRGLADAVAFPSPSLGFLGGFGAILVTRDGGRTWKVGHEPAGGVIRDLQFLEEKTGWAVGHEGLVLRTEDGGGTWKRLPPFTGNRLRSVAFLDGQRGWIAGDANKEPGTLFETVDGGRIWKRVEIEASDLHRFATSPSRLWLVGKGGTVLSRPRRH
jgi:photosystem II stability/assembly factor-like uncharacterized protein